jgi:hypothetical protein
MSKQPEKFEPKASTPLPGSADICFICRTPLSQVVRHLNDSGAVIAEGPVKRTGAVGPIESVYFRVPILT